jgi:hypothetical protein
MSSNNIYPRTLINPFTSGYLKKTILLDESGDIKFTESGSNFEIIDGIEKIRQDIWFILKTVKGSCSKTPQMGVNYAAIVDSKYSPTVIKKEIRKSVGMHRDVHLVKDFKLHRMTYTVGYGDFMRQILLKFNVYLTNGEIIGFEFTI